MGEGYCFMLTSASIAFSVQVMGRLVGVYSFLLKVSENGADGVQRVFYWGLVREIM